MFKHYLKAAWRSLLRRKLYTLINISGLVLGITCSLVIYVFITYELSFDSFHSKAGHIYRIVEDLTSAGSVQHLNTTAHPLAAALRNDFPELEATQTAGLLQFVVSTGNSAQTPRSFDEKQVLFADADFLKVFDFKKLYPGNNGIWLAGNTNTAFSNPASVVLTETTVARYFPGNPQMASLLGRTVNINNGHLVTDLTVGGVIRDPPGNSSFAFTMLVNYEVYKKGFPYNANNWSGNYKGNTYIMIPENSRAQVIETRLPAFKEKYLDARHNSTIGYHLQPLKNIHTDGFYGETPGSYITSKNMLWALAGLAVFLILIAAFNFINLNTAISIRRSKEVSIRKVAGGTRRQLFTQFMTEMVLVALLAMLLSFGAFYSSLSLINQNLGIIQLHLHADNGIFLFALVLILVLSLLAGCYPSLILSGYNPVAVLKNKFTTTGKAGLSLRQVLIVIQFSITFFLLVCMFVVVMQANYFVHKDLGFVKEAVLTVNIPVQKESQLNNLRQLLLRDPNVQDLSYASGAPTTTSAHYGTSFRLREEPVSMMRRAEMKVVDPHYLSLYNLQTTSGRWLNVADTLSGPGNAISGFVVNESLVKMLGLSSETAIGKQLIINEGEAPVIGVVKDFNNNPLQQSITPCLLFYKGIDFFSEAGIRLKVVGGDASALPHTLAFIENTWKQVFPGSIYRYHFLDDALAKNYRVETFMSAAFRLFAGIAIFISSLGLLGLVVFASEQRTREIGVRKVLGATVASIVVLLSEDFLKPVLAAICIASPLTWLAVHDWLQDFAYRISISWWVFLIAGIAIVAIAFVTMSFQAIRAATANPVKSLRSE